MLSMITIALDDLKWFEEVSFESETNGFCNNNFPIVKRLSVVDDSKSIITSVLMEEVCFKYETNGFCSKRFHMMKRLDVVNYSQNLGHLVLI